MARMEERFPIKLHKDPFYEDQPITDLNIDLDKAILSTKPNVAVVDFNRYPKTKEKENLDLKVVMEVEEKKKNDFVDKKKAAKEKFQIKQLFP